MSLELIIGPMFSGKSTELIRLIRIARLLERPLMIVTHAMDTRYDSDHVVSHNHEKEECLAVEALEPLINTPQFHAAHMIFVEEGQFFNDLASFVKAAVDTHGKHVVVAALDGTYKRTPFQQVVDLIPFADKVLRVTALCMYCKDGTPAPFTFRSHSSDASVVLVGGADVYQSLCRHHFQVLSKTFAITH